MVEIEAKSTSSPAVFFVTGTDTDVGKTFAAVLLLQQFASKGFATAAIKPIAAGADYAGDGQYNDDAIQLQKAATIEHDYKQVNPFLLAQPMAPHLAARLEGDELSVEACGDACEEVLSSRADVVVVEGAGGWLVPLNESQTMADLACELDANVVLVVGMRLGCLNHALLTVAAIQSSGLKLAGWIANHAWPQPMAYAEDNIATLKMMIDAPLLGEIPYLSEREVESSDTIPLNIDLMMQELRRKTFATTDFCDD